MASPQAFFADVLPDARVASARAGVPVSVILAQWAVETGFGTSQAWLVGHNYAGVSPGGHVASYPDRVHGLLAYIATLTSPLYSAVRSAPDDHTAAVALGDSPWAASHYGGHGRDLQDVIDRYNLAAYDGGSAVPAGSLAGLHLPGTGITVPTPGDAKRTVANLVLTAAFLAGGLGLVVLGGSKLVEPAVSRARATATQAAETAAVVMA